MSKIYRFGGFEVCPSERTLVLEGRRAKIGSRAFDVLQALIERPNRVVSMEELLAAAWPGVVVEDNNVNVQVSSLRKLLGPHAIRTVAGRGFQFSVPEQELSAPFRPAAVWRETNLAAASTPLIGRSAELARIRLLLAQARLVTLKGPGGIGKSRLATQLGQDVLADFRDGVWLVDLTSAHDAAIVAATALEALGKKSPAQSALKVLAEYLAPRHALLVFDNCEQVIGAVADTCAHLLSSCPFLRIVCTSQELLNIAGEQVYEVPTLAEPEAIALFIARARAVAPDRQFDVHEHALVRHIVRRLDGLSLAIELAAARLRGMAIDELARRLDDRFRLLSRGYRDMPPRHRTLLATFEWSYNLLSDTEQRVFRRLGVFNGPFEMEAAARIASDGHWESWRVVDCLARLVDKSLVRIGSRAPEPTYRLLDTMRDFARSQMDAKEMRAVRTLHFAYYRWRAEAASNSFASGQDEWAGHRRWLRAHYADVRTALEWSIAEGEDIPAGVSICAALHVVWHDQAQYDEGRHWLDLAREHVGGLSPVLRARFWFTLGFIDLMSGARDYGEGSFRRSLALFAEIPEARHESAWTSCMLGLAFVRRGYLDEGKRLQMLVLPLFVELGDAFREGIVRLNLGTIGLLEGGLDNAEIEFTAALGLLRMHNSTASADLAMEWLGECAFARGQIDRAIETAEQTVAAHRESQAELVLERVLARLAKYRLARGDLDHARAALAEAASIFGRYPVFVGELVDTAMMLAQAMDEPVLAARLDGFISRWLIDRESIRPPLWAQQVAPCIEKIETSLGDEPYANAVREGAKLTLEQAMELVKSLVAPPEAAVSHLA